MVYWCGVMAMFCRADEVKFCCGRSVVRMSFSVVVQHCGATAE